MTDEENDIIYVIPLTQETKDAVFEEDDDLEEELKKEGYKETQKGFWEKLLGL